MCLERPGLHKAFITELTSELVIARMDGVMFISTPLGRKLFSTIAAVPRSCAF